MTDHSISYYFTLQSPWAYFGHAEFIRLARQHGLRVDYHPVALGQIFPETGGLPLAKRHPARQNYRMMELQRWRDKRNLPFNLHPQFFPCDIALADRVVLAILAAGLDPEAYMTGVFNALFVEDHNPADPAQLLRLLTLAGFDATALLVRADSPECVAIYAANVQQALAAGVFGSPSYVRDGEIFWGQDRLELLADAVASGRAGFKA